LTDYAQYKLCGINYLERFEFLRFALTFPIFYKKQEILIKKLKVFSDKVDFESKNKVQFFQYLKIFFGLLLYPESTENHKLHRFAFLGVDVILYFFPCCLMGLKGIRYCNEDCGVGMHEESKEEIYSEL